MGKIITCDGEEDTELEKSLKKYLHEKPEVIKVKLLKKKDAQNVKEIKNECK